VIEFKPSYCITGLEAKYSVIPTPLKHLYQ